MVSDESDADMLDDDDNSILLNVNNLSVLPSVRGQRTSTDERKEDSDRCLKI